MDISVLDPHYICMIIKKKIYKKINMLIINNFKVKNYKF